MKDHLTKLNLQLKAHLLVDDCSAHPRNLTSDDGAICCEFLPPNVTSLLQPLDCGVIETAKHCYRHHLQSDIIETQEVLERQGRPMSFSNVVSDISLKDSFQYVATAWNTVRPVTISKAFEPTLAIGGDPSSIRDHAVNKTTDSEDVVIFRT